MIYINYFILYFAHLQSSSSAGVAGSASCFNRRAARSSKHPGYSAPSARSQSVGDVEEDPRVPLRGRDDDVLVEDVFDEEAEVLSLLKPSQREQT